MKYMLNIVTQISARLEVFKLFEVYKKYIFPAFRNQKEKYKQKALFIFFIAQKLSKFSK